jgi:hypothetical protein
MPDGLPDRLPDQLPDQLPDDCRIITIRQFPAVALFTRFEGGISRALPSTTNKGMDNIHGLVVTERKSKWRRKSELSRPRKAGAQRQAAALRKVIPSPPATWPTCPWRSVKELSGRREKADSLHAVFWPGGYLRPAGSASTQDLMQDDTTAALLSRPTLDCQPQRLPECGPAPLSAPGLRARQSYGAY